MQHCSRVLFLSILGASANARQTDKIIGFDGQQVVRSKVQHHERVERVVQLDNIAVHLTGHKVRVVQAKPLNTGLTHLTSSLRSNSSSWSAATRARVLMMFKDLDPNVMGMIDEFRAEKCAGMKDEHGKNFDSYDSCMTFMKKVCKPGNDLTMDHDSGEVTSQKGYCSEYFPSDPVNCREAPDQASCPVDKGCEWAGEHCKAPACTSFKDEGTCPQDRCIFDDEDGHCEGPACDTYTQKGNKLTAAVCPADRCAFSPSIGCHAPPCSTYGAEAECPTDRCGWNAETGGCAPPKCLTYADEESCPKDRCGWDAETGSCKPPPCASYIVAGNCPTDRCGWNGDACHAPACAKYGSEPECPTERCNWDGDSCNTPACRSYTSEDECPVERCGWDGDTCLPPPCSTYEKEETCPADRCAFEGGSCMPPACATYDSSEACPVERCGWDDGVCHPPACSTYDTEEGCPVDRCNFMDGSCHAPACPGYESKASCPSDRCVWQIDGLCHAQPCRHFHADHACPQDRCVWNAAPGPAPAPGSAGGFPCSARPCDEFATEHKCPKDHCAWDGSGCLESGPAPGPAPGPAAGGAAAAVTAAAPGAAAPLGGAPAAGAEGLITSIFGTNPFEAVTSGWRMAGRWHMKSDKPVPDQGYHGDLVMHEDQETMTQDWQGEGDFLSSKTPCSHCPAVSKNKFCQMHCSSRPPMTWESQRRAEDAAARAAAAAAAAAAAGELDSKAARAQPATEESPPPPPPPAAKKEGSGEGGGVFPELLKSIFGGTSRLPHATAILLPAALAAFAQ